MRLLMSFAIIVGLAIAAENVRPQCSMASMTGVEWLHCLLNEFTLVVVHPAARWGGCEKHGHSLLGPRSLGNRNALVEGFGLNVLFIRHSAALICVNARLRGTS